jgi:nitrogenase iron protein NifH
VRTFAIYGKGGGGKSMVSCNLSVQFATRGMRPIQIGCDPKHDSTRVLTRGHRIKTVMNAVQLRRSEHAVKRGDFLIEGRNGIGCIEAGGPESGVGCAGLGIVTAFGVIQRSQVLDDYDVALMDVLGDVVCGGFAMPLTKGLADLVAIVVTDTIMSMYAANNISRAVKRYSRNGIALAGLIANNIQGAENLENVAMLAERLDTRVIASVPFDRRIVDAERRGMPVSLADDCSDLAGIFSDLADELLSMDIAACKIPRPMGDDDCDDFFNELTRV